MKDRDWLKSRIVVLEERLQELRVEWITADKEKRGKIETEAINKKTELFVLTKVYKNRKKNA